MLGLCSNWDCIFLPWKHNVTLFIIWLIFQISGGWPGLPRLPRPLHGALPEGGGAGRAPQCQPDAAVKVQPAPSSTKKTNIYLVRSQRFLSLGADVRDTDSPPAPCLLPLCVVAQIMEIQKITFYFYIFTRNMLISSDWASDEILICIKLNVKVLRKAICEKLHLPTDIFSIINNWQRAVL